MEYNDEVRSCGKAEQWYFEDLELFQKKISPDRTNKNCRRREKVVGKRSPHRKTGLPQDEKLRYFLQRLVEHDTGRAHYPQKRRGGECGNDDDSITNIVEAVAEKNA